LSSASIRRSDFQARKVRRGRPAMILPASAKIAGSMMASNAPLQRTHVFSGFGLRDVFNFPDLRL